MKPTPLRLTALKLYRPPFHYENGYIWDIDPTKAVSDLYDKLTGPLQ